MPLDTMDELRAENAKLKARVEELEAEVKEANREIKAKDREISSLEDELDEQKRITEEQDYEASSAVSDLLSTLNELGARKTGELKFTVPDHPAVSRALIELFRANGDSL